MVLIKKIILENIGKNRWCIQIWRQQLQFVILSMSQTQKILNHQFATNQHYSVIEIESSSASNSELPSNQALLPNKVIDDGDQISAKMMVMSEDMDVDQYQKKVQQQNICQICYVGLYDHPFETLDNCDHFFHTNCIKQSFEANIMNSIFPLKCPSADCMKEVTQLDLEIILDHSLLQRYHKYKSNFSQKQVRKDEIQQLGSGQSMQDERFEQLIKGQKYRQCPKCKFWVQKNEGCDHMTCKCNFQFCYKCGGIYMKCQCRKRHANLEQKRRAQYEQKLRKEQQKKQKQKERREKKLRQKQERQMQKRYERKRQVAQRKLDKIYFKQELKQKAKTALKQWQQQRRKEKSKRSKKIK